MSRFTNAVLAGTLFAVVPAAVRAEDQRVATRPYVEDHVESFSGKPGFQSTIAFADGERVENIAIGESAQWQVTPNRRADLVFIKPVSAAAPVTNMTVVTDRRTYLFELRVDTRAAPVYLMRFAYPAEPDAGPTNEVATLSDAAEHGGGPAAARPEELNFAWSARGARGLYPDRVFDDGRSVYLAWHRGRAVPAILSPAPDGKSEGPVNFTAQGDYLIVEGLNTRLVLRSGRDSATLETAPRAAPSGAGAAPLALGR